jgi:hypothetical protein
MTGAEADGVSGPARASVLRAEAVAAQETSRARGALRTAALIGAAFFIIGGPPLDLVVEALLYPEAALSVVFAWRAVGVAGLLALAVATRRDGRPFAFYRNFAVAVLTLTGAVLGAVASELGGLGGPYALGYLFIVSGAAIMLPSPWRTSFVLVGPAFVALLAALLIGVANHETYRGQLASPPTLASFGVEVSLLLTLAAFSIIGADRQWRVIRQLTDARRFGRYRLERRLGAGGMNEVWLARDAAIGRSVALKVLRVTDSRDDRFARFEREAQLTARLASPHTVRVLDYGQNPLDGSAWIAMERLEGLDLAALLAEVGALGVPRAVHLARQAALSLAEAHGAGLVHRDLKPANLFICKNDPTPDWLKVIDFGIARDARSTVPSLTQTGFVIGTPAFMAPEQMMGQPATPAADVYALGACIHAMLARLGP